MSTAITVSDPVIARYNGAVIRSALNLRLARFDLERDRLVVHEASRWLAGFGLLGLLLARVFKGTRTDIDFSRIAAVARGKFGLNKKILDVEMVDGTKYRLNISDDFAGRIRSQLAQRANLIDAGNERWQVAAA
jgi:hypothetical protein